MIHVVTILVDQTFGLEQFFVAHPPTPGGRQMGSDANMASPLSKGCGSQLNKDIEKE